MDYLVFSDSHGNVENLRQAVSRQLQAPAGVFFLGDGLRDLDGLDALDPQRTLFYRVWGNCDWASVPNVPTVCVTAIEGHTVFFTHGHRFFVKSGYGALLAEAAKRGADIVLFGHTHKPHAETLPAGTQIGDTVLERPMYLFNPGSIGYNTDGNGASFGVLTIRDGAVLLSHGRI